LLFVLHLTQVPQYGYVVAGTVLIYGLTDPVEAETIRYVGKTRVDLKTRVRSGYRVGTKVWRWVQTLRRASRKPMAIVLEQGSGDWKARERLWIAKLRAEGAKLLNVCSGGNGSDLRNPLNAEHRAMLGQIPDTHVARLAGLSRETVTYHREAAGIAAAPRSTRTPGPTRFAAGITPHNKRVSDQELLKLVGSLSEHKIADHVGLNRSSVSRRLRRLGVVVRSCSHSRGHGNAKLTHTDAAEIRAAFPGVSAQVLAVQFNVSVCTIYRAIKNDNRKYRT
jgi:hypothetical protein